jgi:V-type H+-transporting ATPase subunit F
LRSASVDGRRARARAQVADEIRHLISKYDRIFPTILEIPSKDVPYDESKDPIVQRVQRLLGRD